MSTILKLGLGIFLGGTLLVVACATLLAGTPEFDETGGTGAATDVGDRYCSAEKEDELAALETADAINSPAKFRRATRRFIRATDDAPADAWCVDQELEFLIDVWNTNRGDDRYPEAADQVNELRKFERR